MAANRKKDYPVFVRLLPAEGKRLKALAKKEGRSIADVARRLLAKGLTSKRAA